MIKDVDKDCKVNIYDAINDKKIELKSECLEQIQPVKKFYY